MSHILVGHNITFEKPDGATVKPAFYCPMVKCKYHIAESFQRKYFKTFKLLKQHYVKVGVFGLDSSLHIKSHLNANRTSKGF